MDIIKKIAEELQVRPAQVDAAVKLYDEGNTIPFIARYRKEATGGLDDEKLRLLEERLKGLRTLLERKETIIASIEEQGKMTDELRAKIEAAETMVVLEDIYLPYRPKRRTRATMAKEKGLEPLADYIRLGMGKTPIILEAEKYIDAEKGVESAEDAVNGAKDILAEEFAENADIKGPARDYTAKHGLLVSKAKDPEAESVYEQYYDFQTGIPKASGHQILAVNRGEKEKVLTVSIELEESLLLDRMKAFVTRNHNEDSSKYLSEAIEDGYKRLMAPSIEREIRNELTEKAEDGAIVVFKENLKQLLMQPPVAGRTVLGWDPAFRTGCKLSVVDPTGKVLKTTVIYPTAPQNKVAEAKLVVKKLISDYGISLISCGNGTASRESEQIIAEIIKEVPVKVEYVITNEAGASVYSASKLASDEFPGLDVGGRSATSIARRVQDPLAELVKIEPKAIGVGQYQHDLNQKKLDDSLGGTVEACVNSVGVDLNTASYSLLSYISGISTTLAKNIVAFREENGAFTDRRKLLKVPKLGPKAYEQCAGFLRIRGGKEPLDATGVHPESYEAAEKLLELLGHKKEELKAGPVPGIAKEAKGFSGGIGGLAKTLEIGEMTLSDIIKELERPGRDPREDAPAPILRSDVLSMSDLREGMVLKGTVRNVIDFGAFVDIGVHQDGLVHISKICDKYIKHPLEVLSVGDIVEVVIIGIDEKKGRISLSMRDVPH